MCSLAMAFTLGSTLFGMAGTIQQGQAAAKAQEYNAKVQDINAVMAERRAKDALERGKDEEQRKRQEVAQIQGRQRAAMAAYGLDLSFGSPLDTLVDTAVAGELDALTIRTNAAREAYEHEVDATGKRASAKLSRMSASAASKAGYLEAAGTILGGGAKMASYAKTNNIGSIY